jgi:hypothetical protein
MGPGYSVKHDSLSQSVRRVGPTDELGSLDAPLKG